MTKQSDGASKILNHTIDKISDEETTKMLRKAASENIVESIEPQTKDFLKNQGFDTDPLDSDIFLQDIKNRKNGAEPVDTGVDEVLEKSLKSQKTIKVYAVSMGGTHIKRSLGTVSNAQGAKPETYTHGKVKGGNGTIKEYASAQDFWKELFPPEDLQHFKGKAPVEVISLTLGFPVIPDENGDWKVVHFAGKCSVPELGVCNPGETVENKIISLIASLKKYLQSQLGTDIPKIVISPNDTISTELAYEKKDNDQNKLIGAFIAGSGGNVACGSRNYEAGHYKGIEFSTLDHIVAEKTEKDLDLECFFSGKILDQLFLKVVQMIFGYESKISQFFETDKLERLDEEIFRLVYEKEDRLFSNKINAAQKKFFKILAEQIVKRSINVSAAILATVRKDVGKKMLLFGEGSFLTKNLKYVEAINVKYKQLIPEDTENVLVVRRLHLDKNSNFEVGVDASLIGTMFYALGA